MKGVKFNSYHSFNDFSLILNSKQITASVPKTMTVDIPGADGQLDMSEYFGEIKFKNRKITLNFSSIIPYSQFLKSFSDVQNVVHGQRMKITFDDDPNYYYYGRITLDKWESKKNIGGVVATCDCDPYKYKLYKTVRAFEIPQDVTSMNAVLTNARKTVTPTITVTPATIGGSVQIISGETTYTLSGGVYTISTFFLLYGNTEITISGASGSVVKFEYQEGDL